MQQISNRIGLAVLALVVATGVSLLGFRAASGGPGIVRSDPAASRSQPDSTAAAHRIERVTAPAPRVSAGAPVATAAEVLTVECVSADGSILVAPVGRECLLIEHAPRHGAALGKELARSRAEPQSAGSCLRLTTGELAIQPDSELLVQIDGYLPCVAAAGTGMHRATLLRTGTSQVEVRGLPGDMLRSAGLTASFFPAGDSAVWRASPDGSRHQPPRPIVPAAVEDFEVHGLPLGVDYLCRLTDPRGDHVLAEVPFRAPAKVVLVAAADGYLRVQCDESVSGMLVVRDRQGTAEKWRQEVGLREGSGWLRPNLPLTDAAALEAWGPGWQGTCRTASDGIAIDVRPLSTRLLTVDVPVRSCELQLVRDGRRQSIGSSQHSRGVEVGAIPHGDGFVLRGLAVGDHVLVRDVESAAMCVVAVLDSSTQLRASLASVRIGVVPEGPELRDRLLASSPTGSDFELWSTFEVAGAELALPMYVEALGKGASRFADADGWRLPELPAHGHYEVRVTAYRRVGAEKRVVVLASHAIAWRAED
ncbi:MAG: hypothetical protein H6835_04295 [Planctomycetes bacterium]|nr:hypothetical protein [Planctomycetota bacterium]